MIEELQRSVIFFSKANSTLKMQNEELSLRFMEAQAKVAAIKGNGTAQAETTEEEVSETKNSKTKKKQSEQNSAPEFMNEQVKAQAVATQAMYESQGFPAGAARAAAQAMNASNTTSTVVNAPATSVRVSQMQPGATMQAMATFQQAAAAAMQAALGMNPTAAAGNQQQAYAQAMTAFAQQQTREVPQFPGSQQQGMQQAFMAFNPMAMQMAWQQQQVATGAGSMEEPTAQEQMHI